MDELTITVTIADRPYRLNIRKEEEEGIRKAAKTISEKIKQYSENYAFNDRQDLLAMVCLEFANSSLVSEEKLFKSEDHFVDRLSRIDEILSSSID